MKPAPPLAFRDDEVYGQTRKASSELKSPGTALSAAELQILVLVDGVATVGDILRHAGGLGREQTEAALRALLAKGLISPVREPDALETAFFAIPVPPGFFSDADPRTGREAEQGIASLKAQGYYVRIARRRAPPRPAAETRQPTLLVVDDDLDLLKLLRTYFRLEGFATRTATRRAEIMAALREAPLPDLVLLDVHLPDANGFEVLARMRQHPVLKAMPVILLTAEATREGVLKGLQAGADGYITKPFEPEQLVAAVREVLGLAGAAPKSGTSADRTG